MGLVKTRRLAAMHPPSRCALRRTGKQQRAIHLRRGYGGLKAGMKPPVKKGAWALPPHLHKSDGNSAADLPRQTVLNVLQNIKTTEYTEYTEGR